MMMNSKGIPSLNLRKVTGNNGSGDDQGILENTLSPAEVDNRANKFPTEGEGGDSEDLDGAEDSYRDNYSYREYSAAPTPHTSRGVDASELLGCSVFDITDVAVLQSKLVEAQKLFRQLDDWYGKELEKKEQQVSNILRSLHGINGGGVHSARYGGGNASSRSSHNTAGGSHHQQYSYTPRSGYALGSPHTVSSIPSTSLPGTGRQGATNQPGNRTTPQFRSLPAYQETTTSKLRASAFSPAYGGEASLGSARGLSTTTLSARSQNGGLAQRELGNGSTPTPRQGAASSGGQQQSYPTSSAGGNSSRVPMTPRSGRVESSTPQFSSRSYVGGNTSARGVGNTSARGRDPQLQQTQLQQMKRSWDRATNNTSTSATSSSLSAQQPYCGGSTYGGKAVSPRRTVGVSGEGAKVKRRAMTPRF